MKVKELIEILNKLPQDKEVCLARKPNRNYEVIPVVNAELKPIKIGEHLCDGNECGRCDPNDYCIYDDPIIDDIEEHVILKLNENYEEIKNEYEDRKYQWYYTKEE